MSCAGCNEAALTALSDECGTRESIEIGSVCPHRSKQKLYESVNERTEIPHGVIDPGEIVRVNGYGEEPAERGFAPLKLLIQRIADEFLGDGISCCRLNICAKGGCRRHGRAGEFDTEGTSTGHSIVAVMTRQLNSRSMN